MYSTNAIQQRTALQQATFQSPYQFTGWFDMSAMQTFDTSLMTAPEQQSPRRNRVIVRQGNEYFVLPVLQVMMFYTVNKVVFCIYNNGKKSVVEGTNLNQLMEELPVQLFFRANRQTIINIQYIQSFKPVGAGRIQVNMHAEIYEPIMISQENAAEFRKWIGQE
jgi:DNA-binding LytR/AlgR family response regulator